MDGWQGDARHERCPSVHFIHSCTRPVSAHCCDLMPLLGEPKPASPAEEHAPVPQAACTRLDPPQTKSYYLLTDSGRGDMELDWFRALLDCVTCVSFANGSWAAASKLMRGVHACSRRLPPAAEWKRGSPTLDPTPRAHAARSRCAWYPASRCGASRLVELPKLCVLLTLCAPAWPTPQGGQRRVPGALRH
jgi:hypothetical protein